MSTLTGVGAFCVIVFTILYLFGRLVEIMTIDDPFDDIFDD